MATYQEQIQSYVGPYSNVDQLSQFLTAAASRVCDLIPTPEARKYATLYTVDDAGSDIANVRFIEATGNGYRAREMEFAFREQSTDPTSIYYAVSKDPIVLFHDFKVFVLPTGTNNKMLALAYPVVLAGDSDILAGVTDYDEALVLYSAIQCRVNQMEDVQASIPASPTPPDLSALVTAMNNALNIDQDIELAQGYAQDIQTQLAIYSASLQSYNTTVSGLNAQYSMLQASMVSLQKQYEECLQLLFGVNRDSK